MYKTCFTTGLKLFCFSQNVLAVLANYNRHQRLERNDDVCEYRP